MRPATPTRRRRATPGQWGFELYRALNLSHFPSPGSRTTMPLAKISTATAASSNPHDPDHDVDADLSEPASDLGRRPERNPGRERDQQAAGDDGGEVGEGGTLRRVDDRRRDRPRPGEQRDGERHDGDAFLVLGLFRLFGGLPLTARRGVHHRDGEQQYQDRPADPERGDGDAEEAEQGLAHHGRESQ